MRGSRKATKHSSSNCSDCSTSNGSNNRQYNSTSATCDCSTAQSTKTRATYYPCCTSTPTVPPTTAIVRLNLFFVFTTRDNTLCTVLIAHILDKTFNKDNSIKVGRLFFMNYLGIKYCSLNSC